MDNCTGPYPAPRHPPTLQTETGIDIPPNLKNHHDSRKRGFTHRYLRCQTVVDKLIAGSVTSTVSTPPTRV